MRAAKPVFRVAKPVFSVVSTAYETYGDVQRYRSGELGGDLLAGKSVLRGGELGIAVTLLLIPEPTTKVVCIVAGVVLVVLVVADIALDAFNDAKRERTRELLERINNEERFYAIRRQLLHELGDL